VDVRSEVDGCMRGYVRDAIQVLSLYQRYTINFCMPKLVSSATPYGLITPTAIATTLHQALGFESNSLQLAYYQESSCDCI